MIQESIQFNNIAATTAAFVLRGGRYLVSVSGANFGTVTLQQVAGDGSTMIDLKRTFIKADDTAVDLAVGAFGANGSKIFDLAPGDYKLTISSVTACYARITRVPLA